VIEKIEISLRTKLIYHLSLEFDPWWFQDTSLFINSTEQIKTVAAMEGEIDRLKDTFIKEHKKKHSNQLTVTLIQKIQNYTVTLIQKI
jgi:abortive infection bacteriophage resistance protein